jgi:hypothetical protein
MAAPLEKVCTGTREYFDGDHIVVMGRNSVVGIGTCYGLGGPGIKSRWGRDLLHPSRPALGPHPTSYTMGTGSFPGPGVNHPSLLAPRLKKE